MCFCFVTLGPKSNEPEPVLLRPTQPNMGEGIFRNSCGNRQINKKGSYNVLVGANKGMNVDGVSIDRVDGADSE